MTLRQGLWATKRLLFEAYIGFCLLTVIGGWVTGPLFTYCFFGDWRVWRYARPGLKLFVHGYRYLPHVLRWENRGFMFSVPLTAPPSTAPDRSVVQLNSAWEYGNGCGNCTRCCGDIHIRCPILDAKTGFCGGYNSFFWRYFNCGRFPSVQSEIDYYNCPKWVMRPEATGTRVAVTDRPVGVKPGEETLQAD